MHLSKTGMAAESAHYNFGEVQPIDLIVSQNLDFLEGSAVKYICRYKHKGTPMKDLNKALQYVQWLIERQTQLDAAASTKGA